MYKKTCKPICSTPLTLPTYTGIALRPRMGPRRYTRANVKYAHEAMPIYACESERGEGLVKRRLPNQRKISSTCGVKSAAGLVASLIQLTAELHMMSDPARQAVGRAEDGLISGARLSSQLQNPIRAHWPLIGSVVVCFRQGVFNSFPGSQRYEKYRPKGGDPVH